MDLPRLLILIFILAAAGLFILAFLPIFRKPQNAPPLITPKPQVKSEKLSPNQKKNSPIVFILYPLVVGGIGLFILRSPIGAIIGALFGLAVPSFLAKAKEAARKNKFHEQLVDALMVLSSSLKAGLSFIQAIESMVEEMPPPISDEFGLILKENRMGIKIEDSFEQLNKRMPSEDLSLITTAVLIARDTGGNLTVIFENLAHTIREKKKISEQIKTLTTQGKWQGIIMSILPIVFAAFIYKTNPGYMQIMLSSQIGRFLLVYAVISEIIGVFLIRKFTKVSV